jgi:3-hydroxyacyl-CoA dehydrogenase
MRKIEKVAVIGEGKMGSSIFHFLIGFDLRLTWLCSSEEEKEKALALFTRKIKRLWKSGAISEAEYDLKNEETKVTVSPADLKGCDLVIEAITEDLDAKRKLFESLDTFVPSSCIFTSNSSSIVPSLLIPSERRKSRVAGLHFFFPVAMKNTVELITSRFTSQETWETLHDFLLGIHKNPFLQEESHAFILNRILLDFQACAFRIVEENEWSYAGLDELIRTSFFPIGVFEFFDHVGIDVMLASIRSYTANSGDKAFYAAMTNALEAMVNRNQLGIKTGYGFYDYSLKTVAHNSGNQDGKKQISSSQEIKERLWKYYMRSVDSVLDSGLCSREELAVYLKDYLGTDNDPFVMAGN